MLRTVSDSTGNHGLVQVVLAGYYPPPLGGESVHIKELAEYLNGERWSVKILNLRRGAPPSPQYRAVSGRVDFIRALLTILRADTVLHLHTNGHSGKSWLMILIVAVLLRIRRAWGVLTLHSGLCPGYLAKAGRLKRSVIRAALAPFYQIVCVNKEIRRTLESLSVGPERLSVIPAFLGVREAPALSERDSEMIGQMKPLIVVIGGVEPEYGLPLMIDVLPDLYRDFPSLGCIIIGFSEKSVFQDRLINAGLAERVMCLGQIPHNRCLSILSRADIFVRPSYADGDSIAVREALALGVPVVASDTDFRPEGAILFRRGDSADLLGKITHALRNGRDAETPGQGHRTDSLERLLDIYRRLNEKTVSTRGTS